MATVGYHLERGAEALRLLLAGGEPEGVLDMLEDLCYYHFVEAIRASRRGGR